MDYSDRPARTRRVNVLDHRALFTPDVVGTLDYEAAHGKVHARTGEERLMLALIEDAIKRLQGGNTEKEGRSRFSREAEAWIRGSTDDGALSFDFCCDHLHLDPEYLRRGLGLDQPYNPSRHLRLVKHLKPRMVLGPGGPVAQRSTMFRRPPAI